MKGNWLISFSPKEPLLKFYFVFLALLIVALNWPVVTLFYSAEPFIGPFPLVIFWYQIWGLAGIIITAVVGYKVWSAPPGDEEDVEFDEKWRGEG